MSKKNKKESAVDIDVLTTEVEALETEAPAEAETPEAETAPDPEPVEPEPEKPKSKASKGDSDQRLSASGKGLDRFMASVPFTPGARVAVLADEKTVLAIREKGTRVLTITEVEQLNGWLDVYPNLADIPQFDYFYVGGVTASAADYEKNLILLANNGDYGGALHVLAPFDEHAEWERILCNYWAVEIDDATSEGFTAVLRRR